MTRASASASGLRQMLPVQRKTPIARHDPFPVAKAKIEASPHRASSTTTRRPVKNSMGREALPSAAERPAGWPRIKAPWPGQVDQRRRPREGRTGAHVRLHIAHQNCSPKPAARVETRGLPSPVGAGGDQRPPTAGDQLAQLRPVGHPHRHGARSRGDQRRPTGAAGRIRVKGPGQHGRARFWTAAPSGGPGPPGPGSTSSTPARAGACRSRGP